jgi:hypothetical protein
MILEENMWHLRLFRFTNMKENATKLNSRYTQDTYVMKRKKIR